MIKLEHLDDSQLRIISLQIADSFFTYRYNEADDGLLGFIPTREAMNTYISAIVSAAYRSGVLYAVSENHEGFMMLSGEGQNSISFAEGMKMIAAERKALGGVNQMKRFIEACFSDGGSIETRMKKAGRKFLRIEMLAVRPEYQKQGYMRQMMEYAYDLADALHVPVILDTDDKDKCKRYIHLGMKLDRVRNCTQRLHMYDLIREPQVTEDNIDEVFRETVRELYPDSYNEKIRTWLKDRYGMQGFEIWKQVQKNYLENFRKSPYLGGKDNGHASAVYGGLLIFSLYPALPDQPDISELQGFVQELFMNPFTRLGKVFNLNRSADMALINQVFLSAGKRDRKQISQYPEGFVNVSEPYDRKNHISRYRFTQCPNAEFAKQNDLLHVLPLLCNSDFFGISEIHGTLIRESTCGNGSVCDYCVMGNQNPLASKYETIRDENGFLVSRKKGEQ